MIKEEYIKTFDGKILGILEIDTTTGDQTARSWPSRQILGFYRSAQDTTIDFYGRILARGNSVVALIYDKK